MYILYPAILLAFFLSVDATGEISILQSPESITFSGQEELDLSSVKNVFATALGFTVPEGQRWSGMVIKNPFEFADAVVVVAVPGVPSLDSVQGRAYPLNTDETIHDTWDALYWKITERYPFCDNLTLNYISLDDKKAAEEKYGELTPRDLPQTENLQPEAQYDKAFLDQINLLDSITAKIADKGVVNDGVPDVHWFLFPGLHPLVDAYGHGSKVVDEAKRLLSSSVLLLSEVFNSPYDDKVMFSVISSDVLHTRRFRRSANDSDSTYDENYPVMFNIFLWFTVAFVFVLLATTVGIAQMDPGRDSIIYRMTSNRMKKEN